MGLFYVPFWVTFKTHYHSYSKIIVYLITYLVPEMLLFGCVCYPLFKNNLQPFLVFILAIFSLVNTYEVGYVWNETETIKYELDPTKRLTDDEILYYEKHKAIIYIYRFTLTILLNFLLSFFVSKKSIMAFTTIEVVMMIVFFIYNNIRGSITQLIYFFLCSIKYLSITFCYFENFNLSILLASLFVFPIVRTMEYKAHYGIESNVNYFFRKYIIKYDINKITDFRFYATLIILLVSVVLYLLKIINLAPIICSLYIFLYRAVLFISIKYGVNFKGYLKR